MSAGEQWWEAGACRGHDLRVFFEKPVVAKKVCAGCQVRERCLTYALDTKEWYGVWGGTSGRERKRLLRRRSAPASERCRREPKPAPAVVELVDVTGVRRRLQAAAVLGHSVAVVSRMCGVNASTLDKIRSGIQPRATPVTVEAIVVAYPELLLTPVSREGWRTQRVAAGRGWVGPAAWLGLDIDDPRVIPKGARHWAA
ncbi:WhiB family transcriptional regulator [Streptomyces sp. NPDC057554]|uniref:WhiB family transcriptional regulator n=1 Tax=Streptomyces sp. NPDC057554 TaxID=3350538 RepID=UPI0036C23FEC